MCGLTLTEKGEGQWFVLTDGVLKRLHRIFAARLLCGCRPGGKKPSCLV